MWVNDSKTMKFITILKGKPKCSNLYAKKKNFFLKNYLK